MASCSRPRSARRTASSTSARTRPRTCSTRCGSSAASTPRARRASPAKRSPRTTRSRKFISKIESTDAAFQRELSQARRSPRSRTSTRPRSSQPPIPGTVLLFTDEKLKFDPVKPFANVGNLPGAARQVPHHRRPAPARRAALLHARAPRRRAHDQRAVRDLRRQERRLRDRDVRDHQLDADAHQQEPPGRPVREGVVGGARQEVRGARSSITSTARATARCATRSTASAAAASRRSGSCRPSCSTSSTAGRASDWKKLGKKQNLPREAEQLLRDGARLPARRREGVGRSVGPRELHGHAPGHAQGDAARLRRPRRRGRRAEGRPRQALGASGSRRGPSIARAVPQSRASTSASRPRARSSASGGSTRSSAARRTSSGAARRRRRRRVVRRVADGHVLHVAGSPDALRVPRLRCVLQGPRHRPRRRRRASSCSCVAKRPELAAFVRRRGDAITAFNPRDRCWFLADDGLCRVEVEDGRAAKPASCRLFPFNRVFHIGTTMVVDYNSVICPLQIGDGRRHARRDPRRDHDDPGSGDHRHVAAGRRRPRARASDRGGDLRRRGSRGGVRACRADARACAGFEAITGMPWRCPSGATLAAALVLTPSMRFNELYGPRQYRAARDDGRRCSPRCGSPGSASRGSARSSRSARSGCRS